MVEALNKAGHEAIAISRTKGPVAELFSPQVKQFHVPLASKWDLWTRWQISRLIREHKPTIVQTYMSRATRLTRVPKNSNAVHIARLGGYYTLRGNYDHPDGWVGITKDICEYLISNGMPAERVYHIGNFVPAQRAVTTEEIAITRRSLGLPDDAYVIFALGRMIEKKGFQDLIEAYSLLPPTHDGRPLFLLLVGDGVERTKYEELARHLNVWDRVRFAGWQIDTPPYYKQADVFVVPSRHEPLGNIFLEGWMHGVPMVSTLNEGARELVIADRNALVVPVADPKEMASGLLRMLALSGEERQRLVSGGYETVRYHSEEGVVRAYLDLYDKLAANAQVHS